METFAAIEAALLKEGFKAKHTRQDISVFESSTEHAFVYYLGPGKGFECSRYPRQDINTIPSAHTPAPWHIDCTDKSIENHSGYWPIITPEGDLIALVNLQECRIPYSQQEANVKAIAVAGQMLDVLKELIESIAPKVVEKNDSIPGVEMKDYIANKSIPSDKSIKAALAIIKKATT